MVSEMHELKEMTYELEKNTEDNIKSQVKSAALFISACQRKIYL